MVLRPWGTATAPERTANRLAIEWRSHAPWINQSSQGQQQASRRRRGRPPEASSDDSGSFGDAVRKAAQKVQSSLPVIGLISRLATPEGGVESEELAYPEFCRATYDNADEDFKMACYELEVATGQASMRRNLMLVLWMVKFGVGVIANKSIVLAATRLGATGDLEIEIDRFEQMRREELAKYQYMERPKPALTEALPTAADALCRLLGRTEDKPVDERIETLLCRTIRGVFREATLQDIQGVFRQRSERIGLYS